MKAPKINLQSLKNLDFSKVVAILKKRGVLIGSVAVIVIVPLAALLFRGGMTDAISDTMNQRQKDFEKLAALEKTSVTIRKAGGEPETQSVSLNEVLIKALKERNESLEGEFKSQYKSALEHNRKNHDFAPAHDHVVIFPKPAANIVLDESYLGKKFDGEKDLETGINSAYESFLRNNRTGEPPTAAEVLESVQKRELAFIQNNLKKNSRAEVTEVNDLKDLAAALLEARIATLQERAKEISVYLDPNAIRMPPTEGKITLARCFIWQWDLWVLQDIFGAISSANAGVKDGVISAPVKRIMSIRIDPISAKAATGAADAAPKDEAAATEEVAPKDPEVASTGEPAVEEVSGDPINPATEIPANYADSFTGLASCQLYDVRNVKLELVVATADLPKILNCFSRQNFMSVINLKLIPVNVFNAARTGYLYGTEPCSQISMTLQTIWFRDWTTKLMPSDLKKQLGTRGFEIPATEATEAKTSETPENNEVPKS